MPALPNWVRQSAAIPVRDGRVCLVTSSSGKRWVIPKGVIDAGKTAGEAALVEAWEEAGLVGVLQPEPAGSYLYTKYGRVHHVTVFVMQVNDAQQVWPEMGRRTREWVALGEAVERMDEPGLRDIMTAALGGAEVLAFPLVGAD